MMIDLLPVGVVIDGVVSEEKDSVVEETACPPKPGGVGWEETDPSTGLRTGETEETEEKDDKDSCDESLSLAEEDSSLDADDCSLDEDSVGTAMITGSGSVKVSTVVKVDEGSYANFSLTEA